MEDCLENAIYDFVKGNGKGIPSEQICEILINKFKPINDFVKDSLKKKIKKISIMTYGDNLQYWENSIYEGVLSRKVHILDKDGNSVLEVVFDRN